VAISAHRRISETKLFPRREESNSPVKLSKKGWLKIEAEAMAQLRDLG